MTDRVRYRTFMFDNARWEGFEFRDDDIVISTSPKCGTTWMQMLCALLIFQDSHFDRPLSQISPWLDQQTRKLDTVLATLDAQQHRRFIKTHTPFDGLPIDDRVTYLCVGRDPRDVFLSMDHHWANMDMDAVRRARDAAVGDADAEELLSRSSLVNRPDDALSASACGSTTTCHPSRCLPVFGLCFTTWTRSGCSAIVTTSRSSISRISKPTSSARWSGSRWCSTSTSPPSVRELAVTAGFEEMKGRAGELVPNVDIGIWLDTNGFFHQGKSGQWRALLGGEDLAHYEARVRELAPPELAEWIHHGGSRE